MLHRLIIKLSTRKCRGGCGNDPYEFGFHTHHFTPLGRFIYTGSWIK